jgi:hypothetical protein
VACLDKSREPNSLLPLTNRTHYHLVLEGRQAKLSEAMRSLNGRYAQRFNERHQRTGHVFAQRYSAYVIRDESHLEEALRYIAANPVKSGLCERVDDWPWLGICESLSGDRLRRGSASQAVV